MFFRPTPHWLLKKLESLEQWKSRLLWNSMPQNLELEYPPPYIQVPDHSTTCCGCWQVSLKGYISWRALGWSDTSTRIHRFATVHLCSHVTFEQHVEWLIKSSEDIMIFSDASSLLIICLFMPCRSLGKSILSVPQVINVLKNGSERKYIFLLWLAFNFALTDPFKFS